MSGKEIKWLEWKDEDFVIEDIKKNEWESYKNKFPNLSWGTCIIKKGKDLLTVKRFKDKDTCRRYCTAPTCYDLGIGLSKND